MILANIVNFKKNIDYIKGLKLQNDMHSRVTGGLEDGKFFILEHNPVFTVGKRVTEYSKKIRNIDVVKINRGGNITYHGPGQLVIYPIINIKKIGVKKYVYLLEEVIIQLCKRYSITATRNSLNRGVWVNGAKIASVGISIKKGVSIHGIAFNVNNDLTPFSWIDPCGLKGVKITSLEKELNHKINMEIIRESVSVLLKNTFGEYYDFD